MSKLIPKEKIDLIYLDSIQWKRSGTRIVNCLIKEEIRPLGELKEYALKETSTHTKFISILKIPNLGRVSYNQICECLSHFYPELGDLPNTYTYGEEN